LHSEVDIDGLAVHVVVVHLGLIRSSRVRQAQQLQKFIQRVVPYSAPLIVAGDFNDWGERVHRIFADMGLSTCEPDVHPTFPARLPLVQLDYVYVRGLTPLSIEVPRGRIWWRMSDHLPLIAEFGIQGR
jgi:endonuclease/exonuclease/phosphatase family metal-dependent hydrolase